MSTGQIHVVDDLSGAEWIAPRLTDEFGAVTTAVPSRYPAYVRVCHPARGKNGHPRTWSEVARATGRQAHPLMQWHALVGSADPLNMTGSLWDGENPKRGDLDREVLSVLCARLAEETATPQDCYLCLWEGWQDGLKDFGWVDNVIATQHSHLDLRAWHPLSAGRLQQPKLRLPHRKYVVLAGPLSGAFQIGSGASIGAFFAQSPNLLWPADRAWCLASEIDFDSTLVGGSASLIEAVLKTPELDAWRVAPDDSLAEDADKLNLVPA